MTHRERFVRTLTGQEVDRVPFIKVFGGDGAIQPAWEEEHPGIGESIDEILQFDGPYRGWSSPPVNVRICPAFETEVIEEAEGRRIARGGDGRVFLQKKGDFHSSAIDWPVKDRASWEEVKRERLQPDCAERFPDDWPEWVEKYRTRDYPLQLTHGGVYGFARNLMGDLALGYAFYDDPGLVHDIMGTYTDMVLAIGEQMCAEVEFDLIECWEDMASRNGSIVSPQTFREFMTPQYRKIADFAKRHDIPIILVDSDGYIEELTGLMLEGGVTALYPYEVQSLNDVAKMLDAYPQLGVIGGLDKECMARGTEAIDAEMEKARKLIRMGRFIPGPDHFVLSNVTWANYRYFMEQMREVVFETKPEQG